jgi:hypothetical protein
MATPATAQTIAAGRLRELPALNRYINILGPLVMIFASSLIMGIVEPNYFRVSNLMIILQDASVYMIVGMGMNIAAQMRMCGHITRSGCHFLRPILAG